MVQSIVLSKALFSFMLELFLLFMCMGVSCIDWIVCNTAIAPSGSSIISFKRIGQDALLSDQILKLTLKLNDGAISKAKSRFPEGPLIL